MILQLVPYLQPGDVRYFPVPKDHVFAKGHTVTVPVAGLDGGRGVVHRRYFRGDGSSKVKEAVYHILVASRNCPSSAENNPYMLTATHDQLRPPLIGWKALPVDYQWWLNPFNAQTLQLWPAPTDGWKAGDFVSIPSPSFAVNIRICARVVEPEDATGCITVVFKPPFDVSNLVKSKLPAMAIRGPHTDWTLDHREWAADATNQSQSLPAVVFFKPVAENEAAPRKRTRSISPLSLGDNALPEVVAEKKTRVASFESKLEEQAGAGDCKLDDKEDTGAAGDCKLDDREDTGAAGDCKLDDREELIEEDCYINPAAAVEDTPVQCYDWHVNEDEPEPDVSHFFKQDNE